MALRAVPQLALDEEVIENEELEAALEERESRKSSLAAVRGDYKTADDAAMLAIALLELPEEHAVRVGRFRISRKTVKGRIVSFETETSNRVRIAVIGDE